MHNSKKDLVGILDIILVVAIGLVLITAIIFMSLRKEKKVDPSVDVQKVSTVPAKKAFVDPYKNLSLQAKSVYVWDINNKKVLYSYNSTTPLPLASLTKLMTALAVKDTLPEQAVVTIHSTSLSQEGDSGLESEERWSLKNLLDYVLLVSSNDGAHALAAAAVTSISQSAGDDISNRSTFIESMNTRSKSLGFQSLKFNNETGLDESTEEAGAYGSSADISRLMEYILRTEPSLLEATTHSGATISSLDEAHTAKNTNVLVNVVPGLLGSKTGYSDLAGGNLTMAFDLGIQQPIVITVLGSTQDGRFTDMNKLVDATFAYFAQ